MPAGLGARVRFDPDALADDLARPAGPRYDTPTSGSSAKACHSIGCAPARTNTAPAPASPAASRSTAPTGDGDWRMIVQIATDEAGPLLSYLGCGVGHQSRGTRAPDAYQIAHHRLHGRWPGRGLSYGARLVTTLIVSGDPATLRQAAEIVLD